MSSVEENDNINSAENNILINNKIKIDLAKVQDELLITFKKLKTEMENHYQEEKQYKEEFENQILTKFNNIEAINKALSESIISINVKLDKFNELDLFKKKAESQLITHEIRINNTILDLNESKFKYDKIFIDNLTVPGIIGPQAQYKTLRDYLIFNIQNSSSLTSSRDQMKRDLKEIKGKIENINKEIITIINSAEQRCNMYCDNKFNLVENDFKLEDKIIVEKIMDVRMENVKEAIALEKKTKEMESEWEKIIGIKKEIDKKLGDHLLVYKTDAQTAINKYNDGRKDFNKIKRRFETMFEFIKDIRFRKNLENFKVHRNEMKNLVKKLDFKKSESSDSNESKKVKNTKDEITSDEEEFEKKKKVRNYLED